MMSLASRRELLAVTAPRYRAAQGSERSRILEEFVASTGYHRKYALTLLNHPLSKGPPRQKRQRGRHYSLAVQHALSTCWHTANGICSKRLVPYLPELVAVLERQGELRLDGGRNVCCWLSVQPRRIGSCAPSGSWPSPMG
jgi:hypothetical protein